MLVPLLYIKKISFHYLSRLHTYPFSNFSHTKNPPFELLPANEYLTVFVLVA